MIVKSVVLPLSPAPAFELFTGKIESGGRPTAATLKTRRARYFCLKPGGIYERARDGREVELGYVRSWDLPNGFFSISSLRPAWRSRRKSRSRSQRSEGGTCIKDRNTPAKARQRGVCGRSGRHVTSGPGTPCWPHCPARQLNDGLAFRNPGCYHTRRERRCNLDHEAEAREARPCSRMPAAGDLSLE